MKASVFHEYGGIEKLVYEEVEMPKIDDDEVLVRVKACALNHVDIWIREGVAYKVEPPHISGNDVSGIVEKAGSKVQDVKVGDEVIIMPGFSCFKCDFCLSGNDNLCRSYKMFGVRTNGGYAEYSKAPAVNVLPKPKNLTFEEAASFPVTFLTAWHMLITRACIKPKQTVLVLGAGGGIGSAAIQIAKLKGTKVIATAGTDEKLKKAKELGADEVINYSKEDFSKKAREFTNGDGVDVVFEYVGPATWEQSIASLKKNGILVTCGDTSGPKVNLTLRQLFSNQLTVMGSITGTKKELLEIVRMFEQGELKPVIDTVFDLRDAAKAQQRMLERKSFGKIILVPNLSSKN